MGNAKKLGQYFTPEHVADFMIRLSKVSKKGSILEPACGEGVFLKLFKEKGYENVLGYEIDNSLDAVAGVEIKYKSFISENFTEKYDLIIGNPPYIRWKNLDQKLKAELEDNEFWQKYFNSLCDYLYIFTLKSVELLKDGGELIFITPEYWINTKYGQILRDYLVENGYFSDIFHFNETPIFDKVTSSIIIFRFVKSTKSKKLNDRIKIVKYLSTQKLTSDILKKIENVTFNEKIERFEREQFHLGERWLLAPKRLQQKLEKFENQCAVALATSLFEEEKKYFTLGDIADIGNGMVSGLDRAFQVPKTIELADEERKSIISVLKAKDIQRYIHGELTNYIFLNGEVQTEHDLKNRYPTFHKLLVEHREKLEKRYNYNRRINFWEWVFLRSFNLFKQNQDRIFVPCKERISHKDYFRFSYVPQGIFPTQDVTGIFLKPDTKESIYYILALLNSTQVFDWLKHKGVVKGNIVEFSEKPLASIPIKRIDWRNCHEVGLHDEITQWCKNYVANPNNKTLTELNEKVAALF